MARASRLAATLVMALHAAVLLRGWPEPARFLSVPDSREYLTIGANLRQGHGFSQSPSEPYEPDFVRTPVYPAVLALLPGASTFAGTDRASSSDRLVRAGAVLNLTLGLFTVFGIAWSVHRRHGRVAEIGRAHV